MTAVAVPRGADRTANPARDSASAADFDKEDGTCLM